MSCTDSESCNEELISTSLENEYECNNTLYQLNIELSEDFVIIHSQEEYNNSVTGCNPEINFDKFDLIIGKKGFSNGVSSVEYQLIQNCNSSNLQLDITFTLNLTAIAPNLTFHRLIPKLNDSQNLSINIIVNEI